MNADKLPDVERLGGGQVLLRGAALKHTARLARTAAEQVSRRNGDGIPLRPEVVDLLTALEEEARSGSAVPRTEFRRSVPEAICGADDQIETREVARMLGCTDRYVRYIAPTLDGWKRAGRWVFSRVAVAAYVADREMVTA